VKNKAEDLIITWNVTGKVAQVQKSSTGEVLTKYRYDAMGNRIAQEAKSQPQKHYIRDASGNTLAIYEDQNPTELAIYGSARLGTYNTQTQQSQKTLGNRTYELSNHLGNILATITDNKIAEAEQRYRTRLLTLSDYYPFGKEMKGRAWNSKLYRYGFNGKENDHSWGKTIQDYGFRLYSQDYAKFLSVDPLFRSFAWLTPFQFASNRPIVAIDLDGLESLDKNGNITEPNRPKTQNQAFVNPTVPIVTTTTAKIVEKKATEEVVKRTFGQFILRGGGLLLGLVFMQGDTDESRIKEQQKQELDYLEGKQGSLTDAEKNRYIDLLSKVRGIYIGKGDIDKYITTKGIRSDLKYEELVKTINPYGGNMNCTLCVNL
jgi:RHS repeat-associated protein